ncbi:unnamed protein product [Phaeothamnion confervicola]
MDIVSVTATIRVDAETKKGSVIDVIRLVHPAYTSANASQTLTNFLQGVPDMINRIDKLRINGKGKLTPVADAATLVEIIWSLPGTAARDFRRKSAKQVCRLLGGDISLVTEIEARHHQLNGTEKGQQLQEFLLAKSDEDAQIATPAKRHQSSLPEELQLATAEQKSAFVDAWLQERQQKSRMELQEHQQQNALSLVKTGFALLTEFGMTDERDKIACSDSVRRILMSTAPTSSTEMVYDPSIPTPLCHPLHRGVEISMHTLSYKYGIKIPTGKEGIVGKEMKKLYRARYGNEAAAAIPKRNVPFRGQIFPENTYYARDEALMREALERVV